MTKNGFTLIEMLLSISIIAMLAGLSLPVYLNYSTRNDLAIATETTVNALRRAQTYSRGISSDSQWGVAVQSGNITLFKGASYAARDTTYDETVSVSSQITTSGLSEIVFAKLSAVPSTTGSISLTSLNQTRTVSVNAKGMVEY